MIPFIAIAAGYLLRALYVYRSLCAATEATYGEGRHLPYRRRYRLRAAFWWVPSRAWYLAEARWQRRFERLTWHEDLEG